MKFLNKFTFRNEDESIYIPPIEKPLTTEENIEAWFHHVSCGFPVDPNKVDVLFEPEEFYKLLLDLSKSSKSQISLASLYIGSGHLEQKLVDTLSENLAQSNGRLSLNILLDYNRGSRGPVSSRNILLPLVEKFKEQCTVALYHTPWLREPLRSLLPGRANEVVGLQHMKIYAFDDDVVISGANLSHDYFTARQDRYVRVGGARALAAWAHALVAAVSGFSLRLVAGGGDALAPGWPPHLHPFQRGAAPPRAFARAATHALRRHADFLPRTPKPPDAGAGGDACEGTWVFPLVQMAQLGVRHESAATQLLLAAAPRGARLDMATGYFNLPPAYADALLRRCQAHCRLLAAHPSASGFAGARGPAGALPAAYAVLASDFAQRLQRHNSKHQVGSGSGGSGAETALELYEYAREGWTFHAKGLWLSLPPAPGAPVAGANAEPALTLVGSPNFGARSLSRDLELQLALVTRDARLRRALARERDRVFAFAHPAACTAPHASAPALPPNALHAPHPLPLHPLAPAPAPAPAPPLWLRIAARLVRDFL